MQPWFVSRSGFAQRISDEDKARFMRICPEKRYAPGDAVFRSGEPATDLHVIAGGRVKLVAPTASGNDRILAVCGADDFVGEAFLGEGATYRVDAVALTEVVTCPMSRDQFHRVAREAPGAALGLMEVLASHLFACREQLESSFDPVKVRLAKALLELCDRFGEEDEKEPGAVHLNTELKHDELASLTSATRVSITMAFTELRRAGLVEGTRGHYRIRAEALASLTDA